MDDARPYLERGDWAVSEVLPLGRDPCDALNESDTTVRRRRIRVIEFWILRFFSQVLRTVTHGDGDTFRAN